MTNDFAAPVFGIKAKQRRCSARLAIYFAAPVFGIKAKQRGFGCLFVCYFAAPVFGIKAKLWLRRRQHQSILPHPFLESRQSKRKALAFSSAILPHPFLESRQSKTAVSLVDLPV